LLGASCMPVRNGSASSPPPSPNRAQSHLHILLQTLKVKSNGLLIIVRVSLDLQSRILEDGNVVAPGRGRKVDGLGVGVVTLEEGSGDAKSSSARDGLGDGDL
jgi:hypothetical protein